MKKFTQLFFFLTLLSFLACEKLPAPIEGDYLIFGTKGQLGVTLFKIIDEAVYAGNDKFSETSFSDTPMSTDKYESVKDLVDHFPNKLWTSTQNELERKTNTIIADAGFVVKLKRNDTIKEWDLGTILNEDLPKSIRSYLDELRNAHTLLLQ